MTLYELSGIVYKTIGIYLLLGMLYTILYTIRINHLLRVVENNSNIRVPKLSYLLTYILFWPKYLLLLLHYEHKIIQVKIAKRKMEKSREVLIRDLYKYKRSMSQEDFNKFKKKLNERYEGRPDFKEIYELIDKL